jgi:hypothetical protein
MNELELIFIHDQGVLGIGRPTSYGCDAHFLCEGILFKLSLEPDEYTIYAEIELEDPVLKLFEI